MSDRPLAERVEWKRDPDHDEMVFIHFAGQYAHLTPLPNGNWWLVHGCGTAEIEAESKDAAYIEALRIIQRSVLAAADAWRGPVTREVGGE